MVVVGKERKAGVSGFDDAIDLTLTTMMMMMMMMEKGTRGVGA